MNDREWEPAATVLVYVHRNAPTLEALVRRIGMVSASSGERLAVLLVDDLSPDDSWAEALRLTEARPDVGAVALPRRAGPDRAIQSALHFARGELAVFMKADLGDRPEDVPRLLACRKEGFDAVVGCRPPGGTGWLRSAASRSASRLIETATRVPASSGLFMVVDRRLAAMIRSAPAGRFSIPALVAAEARRLGSIPVTRPRHQPGQRGSAALGFNLDGVSAVLFSRRWKRGRVHLQSVSETPGVTFVPPAVWGREGRL